MPGQAPLPPLPRSSRVKATDCVIDIDLAIAIRTHAATLGLRPGAGGDLGFRCTECNQAVKPHDASPRHFEHLVHNPACSLSPGTS